MSDIIQIVNWETNSEFFLINILLLSYTKLGKRMANLFLSFFS